MKILKVMMSAPHSLSCPRCAISMDWYSNQGPRGGWKCPSCGLQIDYK